MRITHTKVVCLFHEVTGVEKSLIQHIITTVEETYIADIRNRTTNSINDTNVLTYLQDIYVQLMPHKLLECEDMVKKTIYHTQEPITSVFFVV